MAWPRSNPNSTSGRQDHRPLLDPVEKHSGWAADIKETQGFAPSDDRRHRLQRVEALRHAAGDRIRRSGQGTATDNQTVLNVFVIGLGATLEPSGEREICASDRSQSGSPCLALELAHANLNELLASAGGKFPTGAIVSFRFDGAWKALEPHGAVLASYITPKTIAASSRDRREHVLQRCR
jgi:hypothetical protein